MKTTVTDIYKEVKRLGIETDNHCSDLYMPVNEISKKVIENYAYKSNVTTFISQLDGKPWYDIPFAYDPYFGEVTA